MIRFSRKFRTDEDGAVTVDWVVLTAAVVALAAAAYTAINTGTVKLTETTQDYIEGLDPTAAESDPE